jgi:hypothetical protein
MNWLERMALIFGGAVAGITVGIIFSGYAVAKFLLNLGTIEGRGVSHLGAVILGYCVGGALAGAVGGLLAPWRRALPGLILTCAASVATFVFTIAFVESGFVITKVDVRGVLLVGCGLGAVASLIVWIQERRVRHSNGEAGGLVNRCVNADQAATVRRDDTN